MNRKSNKNWAEIQQDYNSMANMSCVPSGIKKLPSNYVFGTRKNTEKGDRK